MYSVLVGSYWPRISMEYCLCVVLILKQAQFVAKHAKTSGYYLLWQFNKIINLFLITN